MTESDDGITLPLAIVLTTVAIRGYRSLRDLTMPVFPLTVVTGANGSGKSSLYRALRLLADCGRGRIIASLALEGGLQSAMWAGPESVAGARRHGAVQPTVRTRPISIGLGFASDDFGYLADLGLPTLDRESAFVRDPEIKREAVFTGPVLRPTSTLVRRERSVVETRAESGRGFEGVSRSLPAHRSLLSEFAGGFPELAAVRNTLRNWRFYDGFRVDPMAPARLPQIGTRTPILSDDGRDLAAAIQTIIETADETFHRVVSDAFDGASVSVDVNEGLFEVRVHQRGMLRALRTAELSDGTLRFLLWAAALLSTEPPALMVLNEPETSLHPDLVPALGELIREASERTQVVVITHSDALLLHLRATPLADMDNPSRSADNSAAVQLELEKDLGETRIQGLHTLAVPPWSWGSR